MSFPVVRIDAEFGGTTGTHAYLVLDDTTLGKFDTGKFAPSFVGYEITDDVRGFTISRGRTRLLEAFSGGTATIELDNSSGNYDPNNLSGLFVTAGVSLVRPMVKVRIRAVYGATTYNLFYGYADAWDVTYPGYGATSVTTLRATDGFKVLARIEPGTASEATGGGEHSGTRIGRLLNSASWPPADRDLDTGNSPHAATTLSQNVLSEMQQTAFAEGGGYLYMSTAGDVVFRDRHSRIEDTRSTTTQATFDDQFGTVTTASDSFNRADSTTTMGHTDGGASLTWTPNSGTWGINTNQAYSVTSTAQATTVVETSAADGFVEVTCSVVADAGVCWRSSDDNNNWIISASTGQAFKRVGGAFTAVGAAFTALTNGDVLRVEFSGSNHTIKVNGATVRTFSDAHNSTATKHGLRANSTTTVRFDSFSTTAPTTSTYPYSDIVLANDDDLIKNLITAQRDGGAPQSATDSTSVGDYMTRSYNVTLSLDDDVEVDNWCDWILALFKDFSSRVDGITLRPQRTDALWPVVLGSEFGDLMVVNRRPDHGDVVTKSVYLEGIDHSVTGLAGGASNPHGFWETKFRFASATAMLGLAGGFSASSTWLRYDNATVGKFDTGKLGVW